MKTKSIVLTLCALLGVASLPILAANQKDDSFTVSGNVILNESRTVGYLDIKAGAWLDLNGYDLIIEHGSETVSAVITNSSATLSHISFTPHETNGWGAQFQNNLKFGGNLELTVCGITNGSNDWSQRGFQNAVNTHTGGTVLDGYGSNTSETGIYLPRINNTTFCGSGPLTLKNGATLMFTGNENTTFSFPKIIFEGGTEERPNWFKSDRTITITSPIECASSSDILHLTLDPGKNLYLTGDLTAVKGIIRTKPKGNGNIQFQQATDGMPSGVLRLYLHDANTDASVRYSGSGTEFALGGLDTDPSITKPNAHARIQKTVEGGNVTLKVGSANQDNIFYGKIQRDSATKDWNVEKVGTGTWTLAGGNHSYEGTTTLTSGKLKFAGAGKIHANSQLVFNGGTLGFAADSTNTIANTIVATDAPLKVDADEGANGVLSGTLSNVSGGIAKTGSGAVKISNLSVKRGSSNTEVLTSDGYSVTFDEGTLGVGTLALDTAETLDLNGRNLIIGSHSQTTASNGGSLITNSSGTLSTITAEGPFANKTLAFAGNVRYVVTGGGTTHFRDTSNKGPDGETVVANTHTGGTVISNTTNQLRFYSPDNFGTGPIVLCNASLMRPSSNIGDANFSNPWEFYGNNFMELQNWANNTGAVNLKGPWTGDGFVHIQNGWVPTIELNGDMADFTGTLEIAYKDKDTTGFWMRGDNTNGLPRATLKLANVSNVDAGNRRTFLRIKPGNNATVSHSSTITSFPIGHLVTDGDDPADYVNSYIMDCQQWANCEWEIGALNQSGTFAGWFTEEAPNNSKLSIKKVGAGTWTWTSSLHTFQGNLIVAAGRMNINSENLTNCAVVVKRGATLGGTGTLSQKASVTVEEGGVLVGSLTLSAGVTFESGAVFDGDESASITGDVNLAGTVVDVDDVSAVTDGQVFLTVNGTATGKPSVSAALAAVEKYNGRRGKWGVTATTANGVTTYSLAWNPTAFMVIFR